MSPDLWYVPEAPGCPAPVPASWYEARTSGGFEFRSPVFAREEAEGLVRSVRRAALELRRKRHVSEVVNSVSAAALRLADPDDPVGASAASCLIAETGWSPGMVRDTLDGMAKTWTVAALTAIISGEFGDAGMLDGFEATGAGPGRARRAVGPPVLGLVQAGNVPGTGVSAVIRGLLVRSGVVCKLPADEPGLTIHFARSLAEVDPELAACLLATWWPPDAEDEIRGAMVKHASKVIIYGGEEAVLEYRRVLPATTDLVVYGPRIGVAVVLDDSTTPGPETALAADMCAYEQSGCVSPRLVYVVASPARDLAERLASALRCLSREFEPPAPTASEAAAVRALRASAEFASYGQDAAVALFDPGNDDFGWTVISSEAPGAQVENLPRTALVYRIESVGELGRLLDPLRDRIQVFGYHGSTDLPELTELAVELGACRVAPIGSIAWPPADWRHDGRFQLLPLVRWTDLEEEV